MGKQDIDKNSVDSIAMPESLNYCFTDIYEIYSGEIPIILGNYSSGWVSHYPLSIWFYLEFLT
jgi:hypothetical protein